MPCHIKLERVKKKTYDEVVRSELLPDLEASTGMFSLAFDEQSEECDGRKSHLNENRKGTHQLALAIVRVVVVVVGKIYHHRRTKLADSRREGW